MKQIPSPFGWHASRLLSWMIGGFLLLMLTGLFRQTQAVNVDQHYQTVEQFRALERAHLVITADLLKTEFLIIDNYDTLVADRVNFDHCLREIELSLSPLMKTGNTLKQRLNLLKAQASKDEIWLEDFKSEHAVLQNSTAYLPGAMDDLLNELPEEGEARQLDRLLEELFHEMLLHTLEDNTQVTSETKQLIEQIETFTANRLPNWQPAVDNVLRHSQAIIRLRSDVDRIVTLLSNSPTGSVINQLAIAYDDYQKQVTRAKNRYRLLLYAITVALAFCSLYLAWHRQNAAVLTKINHRLGNLVAERTQDLNQALEKLKWSQAQLVQAEKMSGLGQLSAGIAHEINNPISFIHGNVEVTEQYSQDCLALLTLYQQHYPHPAEDIQDLIERIDLEFLKADWVKLLASMKTGTSRVKKIVESLRNFSRLDESAYKLVDIHEGLDNTLLLVNHKLSSVISDSSPVEIIKSYGTLPQVLCHPASINQVFLNIIDNAIDALQGYANPKITICTTAHSDCVVIAIADNGSGIPEDIRSKIFDPFFTSKPVGQGTGLGLTICYQTIVEAHKGQIDVTPTPAAGTEFRIQLPLIT